MESSVCNLVFSGAHSNFLHLKRSSEGRSASPPQQRALKLCIVIAIMYLFIFNIYNFPFNQKDPSGGLQ